VGEKAWQDLSTVEKIKFVNMDLGV